MLKESLDHICFYYVLPAQLMDDKHTWVVDDLGRPWPVFTFQLCHFPVVRGKSFIFLVSVPL
jgi:hypothetical protein